MTILGVTGSVALLFTGFGVQHSISEIKDRQFGSIIKYDMIVAENMDTNTDKLYKMLEANDVKEYTKVYYDDASIQAGDKDDRSEVKVIIPETQKDFAKYIGLDHRETKTKIHLKDEKVSEKFLELDSVKGIVQNTTLTTLIDTIVKSLNKIMEVLILIATLLSIVILYNLTNINVCERIRELSTIKVLGFYENEVTMYIYRETILLSIIGIIVAWFVGMWLHHYILVTVPPEDVMFNPVRWIGAYIVPLVLIFVVLLILKFFINKKLKNVDMLEALKSVD